MGRKLLTAAAGLLFLTAWTSAYAQDDRAHERSEASKRVRMATDAFQEIMRAPDNAIPQAMKSEFKIGGDAEAAAGPVGRKAAASTDVAMRAQIVSYSRARGLFAGVSLSGASVHEDVDANESFYGSRFHTREIALEGAGRRSPQIVAVWRDTLDKYFMSDRAATSGKRDEIKK